MTTHSKIPTGTAVTYLGSLWTEPAKGFVVRDEGERKVSIEVTKPYHDPYQQRVQLHVRRSSITIPE